MINTIYEGRAFLLQNRGNGATCPCCSQFVKEYRRAMHSSMTRTLITLYRISKGDNKFRHIREFNGIGDFTKFRHWGFIEEMTKPEDMTQKRTSGFWRLTEQGRLFVEGKIQAHSHILLLNREFISFEGNLISVRQALGRDFDYEELMLNV